MMDSKGIRITVGVLCATEQQNNYTSIKLPARQIPNTPQCDKPQPWASLLLSIKWESTADKDLNTKGHVD